MVVLRESSEISFFSPEPELSSYIFHTAAMKDLTSSKTKLADILGQQNIQDGYCPS